MRKLTRIAVLSVLALWGLAAMHCSLGALPGMEFLEGCSAELPASSPQGCESDGCGVVEDGSYRAEEQTASAPQPALVLALAASLIEVPLPVQRLTTAACPDPPPDLPKAWQFSFRTALPPRAPSLVG